MNKFVIPTILVGIVMIGGIFAFIPVDKATTVHTFIVGQILDDVGPQFTTIVGTVESSVRDNTTVTHIILDDKRLVLVDNAGIGGTSDVEMTWRFDGTKCGLNTFTTTGAAMVLAPFTPSGDDGDFAGNPAHNDETGVDGVVLFSKPGMICVIDPTLGEFVTVSTVGALG